MLTASLPMVKSPLNNKCSEYSTNNIRWEGSSPGALGYLEYPFIAITLNSTLPQTVSNCKGPGNKLKLFYHICEQAKYLC